MRRAIRFELLFLPADGIIIYQKSVARRTDSRDQGQPYLQDSFETKLLSLRAWNRNFMTFFDVHVNRVPYPG